MANWDEEDLPEFSEEDVKPDLRVGFLLVNHFTLVPVAGLVDSLRFAADRSFRSKQIFCRWDWMTIGDQPVSASCGMPVLPTKSLDLLRGYDYIVVAGGLLDETRDPSPALVDAICEAHAAGIPIIALCSASFVLGKAGLLDGRRCAVHFTIRDEFNDLFPGAVSVIDEEYVQDGPIITCPGGTAIQLAAMIIGQHCGRVRANKGLEFILAKEAQSRRGGEDDRSGTDVYENDMVRKALAFMRDNIESKHRLEDLARIVGTHPRQLHRAFISNTNMAPMNYLRKMRLDAARRLLADTSLSITSIAMDCGFSDASHFIMWFRKQFGETPHAYRKRRHDVERLVDRAPAPDPRRKAPVHIPHASALN